MVTRFLRQLPLCVALGGFATVAEGQIDPTRRQLIQFGYNQPVEGRGPIAGYAFYFLNQPGFLRTNITMRLAVAPVYLDSEFGFKSALGPHTDLGLGVAGGGFADTHEEIRGGSYLPSESFTGHGGEVSASVYHLFNPAARIPLHGVARAGVHFTDYSRDGDTAAGLVIPGNRNSLRFRTGLRYGGREPLLTPELAMELSAWHELRLNDSNGPYGFGGDRFAEGQSQLFWGRALLAYTLPETGGYATASVTAGTSLQADRLSGYELGGALPLASEFPLYLPGYYFGEITARQFVLLGALYAHPISASKRWTLNVFGTTAAVDYVTGMNQPGQWHSGLGGGVGYRSPEGIWQGILSYGYGVDALRGGRRGAHSIGLLLQYDLETRLRKKPSFEPGVGPDKSRWLERFIRRIGLFN